MRINRDTSRVLFYGSLNPAAPGALRDELHCTERVDEVPEVTQGEGLLTANPTAAR